MRQGADTEPKLQEAIDTCPVNCIHWVTAPQLSLLEAAMEKMERIAVWALMAGNGSGKDVFNEASIAWEKRQAAVRARLQEEETRAGWAKFSWSAQSMGFAGFGRNGAAGANFYSQPRSNAGSATSSTDGGESDAGDGADPFGGAGGGGRERQRIAQLAARAARAARQYQQWREVYDRRKRVLIAASTSAGGESEVE
ncbi:hypothetical protein MNEG_15314 [Monoraphidium neglectum]|uniref:Uncharacterized protein n=1 Tax=Monoraphidium neglectum TaxID=145388 RepID=A0A0D2LLK2_9CHLO|nr:hypothetical protein MNEG_15314 [Monoraphidium neglectum]KIY92649.1 hypothetical protein MNEG_15314 [Monoraphidium neglectum]|eukprot:XP_013891669.1 hypothetical protein MNEG_15314 [Monoraphidium neglectum]